MPLHHMRSCCSGVASMTQPSMVYGMLSEGTRPSTWSMEKKGTPKYCGILLVPAERGERDRRAAVGQGAHGPVLGGELGVEEEQVLGRRHPDDQALLFAAGGAGAAQDGLVGEAVGAGGLHVEDLGPAAVGRLGGQPAREDGGHLVGITLADVGHGAALYRRTRAGPVVGTAGRGG